MKKSTNNYERPEVQVVHVETETGFAGYNSQGLQDFSSANDNYEDQSEGWII